MTMRFFRSILLLFATLPCARAQPTHLMLKQCVRRYAPIIVFTKLIAALIDVESRWNPRAVSERRDGADATDACDGATLRTNHPFDVKNIRGGDTLRHALMWSSMAT